MRRGGLPVGGVPARQEGDADHYYRKQRGYTQQQLAELTSYSKNHIQQIETAKTLPSVIALLDIAEALEIPPSKLFEFR